MANRKLRYIKQFTEAEVSNRINGLCKLVLRTMQKRPLSIYPVPPQGAIVAPRFVEGLQLSGWSATIVDAPDKAHICLDSAVNTGRTRNKYVIKYGVRFLALVNKADQGAEEFKDAWIVFPWQDIEDVVPDEVGIVED
jgi:hypothetical protein